MFNLVPQPVKNFIDTIFNFPLEWLISMRTMLNNASLSVGYGIDLNQYFAWFAYLPDAFQTLITSLIASFVLLIVLYLVKVGWNMYLNIKNSVKWW